MTSTEINETPMTVSEALAAGPGLRAVGGHLLVMDSGLYLAQQVYSIERHMGSRKYLIDTEPHLKVVADQAMILNTLLPLVYQQRNRNKYDHDYNVATVIMFGEVSDSSITPLHAVSAVINRTGSA
jgi:hypothetical protein